MEAPMNMKQAAAQLQKAMANLMGTSPKRASHAKSGPKKSAAKRSPTSARKARSTRAR
jgi:DNA-binding transcriptional regulator YdaS (Cro superfamily)